MAFKHFSRGDLQIYCVQVLTGSPLTFDLFYASVIKFLNLIAWLTLRVATRYHADRVHHDKP
jgi:hypothetical protein